MKDEAIHSMPRSTGVTAIASLFLGAALFLCAVALILLLKPGSVSLMVGSSLIGELGLAGPYMFILVSAVAAAIGAGLWWMNNWARWLAILAAIVGIVMLIPTVSAAATGEFPPALFFSGLGMIVRVMIVWYLFQAPVVEAFLSARSSKPL